jgi:hypothetical protein
MELALKRAGIYTGPLTPGWVERTEPRDWVVVLEHLGARSAHHGSESECRWIATNPNRLGTVVEGPRSIEPADVPTCGPEQPKVDAPKRRRVASRA